MKKLLLARFVPWFPVACRWLGRAALAVSIMGAPVFFASRAMEDPLNWIFVALWAIWIGSMVLLAYRNNWIFVALWVIWIGSTVTALFAYWND